MKDNNFNFLTKEQKLSITLKALYKSYGYNEFRLPGFDEYSLYADNQSFIGGKDVVSFSVGGKLLALRPDVTLSIIKNGKSLGNTQKLFYDEKVYRKTARGGLAEVSQIGVEIIGDADIVSEAELCTLILKTLAEVNGDFVLDFSHTGIIVKLLDSLNLNGSNRTFAVKCLEGKNVHDFIRFAKNTNLDESKTQAFMSLINLSARSAEAKLTLDSINKIIDISEEIDEMFSLIEYVGGSKINIDFSIGGDTDYYNGLIFKGYVKGVPHAVLSGGRYDKLLSKFGRTEKAMGFALYLGELCKYLQDEQSMPDAVLVYSDESPSAVLQMAEDLRNNGIKLLTCKSVPAGFNGKIYYAENFK